MYKKVIPIITLISLVPLLAGAAPRSGMLVKGKEAAIEKELRLKTASTTEARDVEKAGKKAALALEKQEKIRKFLDKTIENYGKLVGQIESLAKRAATREGIMFDKGIISPQDKAAIDAKLLSANEMITAVKTKINNLENLSSTLLSSDKPGQEVKALRKASNEVKDDIKAAHREVVKAIELLKASADKGRNKASSTPEKRAE